jgi:hypothetical protein
MAQIQIHQQAAHSDENGHNGNENNTSTTPFTNNNNNFNTFQNIIIFIDCCIDVARIGGAPKATRAIGGV